MSSPARKKIRIFSPNTLKRLQDVGGTVEPSSPGYHTIQSVYLTPPLSHRTASTSSTLSHVSIPEVLDSKETLEYIGFKKGVASKLWERALKSNDSLEVLISEYIQYWPENVDCDDGTDAWERIMDSIGIKQDLQRAIMNPVYRDIRQTNTLLYWVLDSLLMNLDNLEHLDSRVSHDISEGHLRGGAGGEEEYEPLVLKDQVQVPADYVCLWKGIRGGALKGFVVGDSIAVNSIASGRLSDFGTGVYFADELETAGQYAQYAKHRAEYPERIYILQALVPKSFINTLEKKTKVLGFDDLWKSIVWHFRTGRDQSKEWRKEFSKWELIKAPTSKGASEGWAKKKDPKSVRENQVLRLSTGKFAMQWVFMEDHLAADLADCARFECYDYLSGRKIEDLSTFKFASSEDPVPAEEKEEKK